MAHGNDIGANDIAVLANEHRRRQLQFLSALALVVAIAMSSFTIAWGMWEVAVPSFFYGPICLFTIVMLRRRPEWIRHLTTLFILATLAVTQSGVFLQKPGAVTDPWIMTCPVVAYGLCSRRMAAGWTTLTVLLLFALRPFQPFHSVTLHTTTILALATVAIAIVFHLYSRYTDDNERLIVELSNTDSLTVTLNRRAFQELLPAEFRRNLRQHLSMTVFMIDADHFKRYNDRYGHVAGDAALAAIARVLKQTARRAGDFVFRYGGEEFCVLCSGLGPGKAAAFAEQLRAGIEALAIEHGDSPLGRMSVSIGYRHAERLDSLTPSLFVEQADQALYAAKAKGRNRVECYFSDAVAVAA